MLGLLISCKKKTATPPKQLYAGLRTFLPDVYSDDAQSPFLPRHRFSIRITTICSRKYPVRGKKKKHESNYLSLSCLFPPQREEKKVIAFISMRINLIEDFLMIVLFFSPNPDTPYHRSTHLSPLLFSPYLPQISHPQLVSPTHTHPLVLSFHLAL